MFKKVAFIIGLIFITYDSFSQNSVSDYKYVVVASKFDFLKVPNEFRLNNLTKLLFEKYGFIALMDEDILPDDAISNSCLVLNSEVIKEKSMFITKLKVKLKYCKGEVIFTSKLGESREKKYQVAYTLALREAFKSFEVLNYKYQENPAILAYGAPNSKANEAEIEKLKEEITQLKEEKLKEESTAFPQEANPTVVHVIDESLKPDSLQPNTLIAKDIFNGYQLLDSASKVIMTIYTSGVKDVFIVKGKDAIIYKKGEIWIYSETNETNLLSQAINIKF